MLLIFSKIIIASIIVEALTELLSKSEFFNPLRDWLFEGERIRMFFFTVLECGYCTSVWVAFFVQFFVDVCFINVFIDWFIIWILVHRISNVVHFLVDRVGGRK